MITQIRNKREYQALYLGDVKPIVKIGGSQRDTEDRFVPNVNASFHCDSGHELYFLNLNRKDLDVSLGNEPEFNNGVIGQTFNIESHEYSVLGDRLKWSSMFSECPASFVIEFDLKCSQELTFYKQPEDEPGSPENVKGSYAVYCDKSFSLKDQSGKWIHNTKNGKLCHIYRSKVTDSKGKSSWCSLNIVNDQGLKLRISLPEQFMRSAQYPVIRNVDVGWSTEPGSWTSGVTTLHGSGPFTLADNGTITELHAWGKNTAGATDFGYRVGIYNYSGANPNSLIDESGEIDCPFGGAATDLSEGGHSTAISAADYFTCLIVENATFCNYGFDSSISGITRHYDTDPSYGPLPATYTSDGTTAGRRVAIWAVVTVGGASIMNQLQGPNLGADLFNGTLL